MKRILNFIFTVFILITILISFVLSEEMQNIKVGVYADFGSSEKCVKETIATLKIDPNIKPQRVAGADIVGNVLDHIDAIVFPGGSGSKQSCSLGDIGRKKVINFVKNGGGYLGICAGAYLGSDHSTYSWCLHLADAQVVDREHWDRGGGLVNVKLTKYGKELFPEIGEKDNFYSYYHNGPLLTAGNNPDIEDPENIAIFNTDVHLTKDSFEGIMPGTTFLLSSKRGKGRVILCSGHPESTPGARWIIPRLVRWTTKNKLTKYNPNFVDLDKFSQAILFDDEFKKTESNLLRKLKYGNKDEKLSAMKNLEKMGSREFPKYLSGLLRDSDPRVRKLAVEILLNLDYLLVEEDLKQALREEQNMKIIELLEKASYNMP